MNTDSYEAVKHLNKSIYANDLEKFNLLLAKYAPVLQKDETIHALYGITMNIVKKIKDYKPYIDSIYNHGLSLNYKKTKQACYTYDILTSLLSSRKKEIVDYLVYEHKYPKNFYATKNYLAEIILYRKLKEVEQLLSEGFKIPSYQTAFDFIHPENFSKSIKQICLLQQYKRISPDNTEVFSNIFINNYNSFTLNNLKKLFKIFSPNLSDEYFLNKINENPFFIKHIMDDYKKIDLLEQHGFSLKNYLAQTEKNNLIKVVEILIPYFTKIKVDNISGDINTYLENKDCYPFFAHLKYPDNIMSHMRNFNYHFQDRYDHSFINVPAILKLFNFDAFNCSKEEFHNFTNNKFSILYNTAEEMWNISEIYKKNRIEYEKTTLNSLFLKKENVLPISKKRL